MKKKLLFIVLAFFILLAGYHGFQLNMLLHREIEDLHSQMEDMRADLELHISQAEEATWQLVAVNDRVAELEQELEEAMGQRENHAEPAPSFPITAAVSGEADCGGIPGDGFASGEAANSSPVSDTSEKTDLLGLGAGVAEASLNHFDLKCIHIMESSGTWGKSVAQLLPSMTEGGVEKVVAAFLERHLYPGITAASDAEQIRAIIAPALPYLSAEAQTTVSDILAAFE